VRINVFPGLGSAAAPGGVGLLCEGFGGALAVGLGERTVEALLAAGGGCDGFVRHMVVPWVSPLSLCGAGKLAAAVDGGGLDVVQVAAPAPFNDWLRALLFETNYASVNLRSLRVAGYPASVEGVVAEAGGVAAVNVPGGGFCRAALRLVLPGKPGLAVYYCELGSLEAEPPPFLAGADIVVVNTAEHPSIPPCGLGYEETLDLVVDKLARLQVKTAIFPGAGALVLTMPLRSRSAREREPGPVYDIPLGEGTLKVVFERRFGRPRDRIFPMVVEGEGGSGRALLGLDGSVLARKRAGKSDAFNFSMVVLAGMEYRTVFAVPDLLSASRENPLTVVCGPYARKAALHFAGLLAEAGSPRRFQDLSIPETSEREVSAGIDGGFLELMTIPDPEHPGHCLVRGRERSTGELLAFAQAPCAWPLLEKAAEGVDWLVVAARLGPGAELDAFLERLKALQRSRQARQLVALYLGGSLVHDLNMS